MALILASDVIASLDCMLGGTTRLFEDIGMWLMCGSWDENGSCDDGRGGSVVPVVPAKLFVV